MPTSSAPTRKVTAAGIGGACAIVVVWCLSAFAHTDVPAEVAAAFATLLSFAAGYIVREG